MGARSRLLYGAAGEVSCRLAGCRRSTLSELTQLAAFAIFLASYAVFAIGKFPGTKIDRPGMAIIGAVLMFTFRVIAPADSLRFIDFPTLVLLFSMMVLVAHLHLDGFFDWVTELAVARLQLIERKEQRSKHGSWQNSHLF